MKHLVIAVSPDSSLELLGFFADIIVLDKGPYSNNMASYDTLYVRSHFSRPETLPQNFRTDIEDLVQRAKHENPDIKFIDDTSSVDAILGFEDKWFQYKTFADFMPRTQLFDDAINTTSFKYPVFKKRLSSRGKGVTWNVEKVTGSTKDWIVQESLNIDEELRIYVVCGEVYPLGTVRQSKTSHQGTKAIDARELTQDEIDFSSKISKQAPSLDIIGLDVARTSDEKLNLLEVNRSPGFAAFAKLTGVNLADILYSKM